MTVCVQAMLRPATEEPPVGSPRVMRPALTGCGTRSSNPGSCGRADHRQVLDRPHLAGRRQQPTTQPQQTAAANDMPGFGPPAQRGGTALGPQLVATHHRLLLPAAGWLPAPAATTPRRPSSLMDRPPGAPRSGRRAAAAPFGPPLRARAVVRWPQPPHHRHCGGPGPVRRTDPRPAQPGQHARRSPGRAHRRIQPASSGLPARSAVAPACTVGRAQRVGATRRARLPRSRSLQPGGCGWRPVSLHPGGTHGQRRVNTVGRLTCRRLSVRNARLWPGSADTADDIRDICQRLVKELRGIGRSRDEEEPGHLV